jgi:hypothetical protein
MKICPNCQSKYPDDANFCPQEACASADGPQRLQPVQEEPQPRFSPTERIGGSGTGEVWRARDTQTEAEVALKFIAPEVAPSQAAQARVEREFKQLMRVASPRVASILDCGRMADERIYVAMEYCPGDTLANVLASGPVDLERAKSIVSQIGQALLEAQKAGLVHRDIAPKNVLIAPSGDVKVINFPLATPINDKVAGDPAYLSPEQAQGKPVDQRSNTYSLAAILYHLLTGEPPFQAATPEAVLDMHVSVPPLPPSQRRPDAAISPDADRLVLKALDKSSSRRHLTLRLFLTELEALTSVPAFASPVPKPTGKEGMAKTMLFGGNQAEIARMVAEARAAKSGGTSPSQAVQPAQPVQPAQSMAATLIQAAPRVSPVAESPRIQTDLPVEHPGAPAVQAAPVPAQPITAPAAAISPPAALAQTAVVQPVEAGKAPPPKAGAAFRETLWFKKGDVEQLVADAKAKMAAGKGTGEVEVPTEDTKPLEDRYVDDGSVTTEDRKKFSLRTGGTATALPATAAPVPGEKMTEEDMVNEIGGSRRSAILIVAVVVVIAVAIVVVMMMRGKAKGGKAESAGAAPTVAAATPSPPSSPPSAIPGAPPVAHPASSSAPVPSPVPAPSAQPVALDSPKPVFADAGKPIAGKPSPEAGDESAAPLGASDDTAKGGGAVRGAEPAPKAKPGKHARAKKRVR